MNFGQDESFLIRHQYFFQNFFFKFEGLTDKIKTGFEEAVKALGGIICNDADYILTEKSYFQRAENINRTDLYSINYILDSMRAKKPLDITKYRFVSEKSYRSMIPCCLFSKYFLRTDSCMRYYYDNICCELCGDNNIDESVNNIVENNGPENNTFNNCILPSNTKVVNSNILNNKMLDLSFNYNTKAENARKNDSPKLNGISNKKIRKETESLNVSILTDEFTRILNNDKDEFQNGINKKIEFVGKLNENCKLPTISLSNEKTNESAKKLKMSYNNNSVKTQQTDADLNFKIHSKNHKENSKNFGYDEIPKKQETAIMHPAIKSNILFRNTLQVINSKEMNNNARKNIHTGDYKKHIKKHKCTNDALSNNETISSSDDANINLKQTERRTYKRIRRTRSNNDSSTYLSDSSSIRNRDDGPSMKSNYKKVYGKKRCKHNVSVDRNSTSSSEDEVNKITKKIRKFNSDNIKTRKQNINEIESSEGELSFTSSDEVVESMQCQWWYHLPKLKNIDPNYVETKRNLGDRRRGSTFSMHEQRLMIAYLIVKNKIDLGTSRIPWREMLNDGYLRNRSSESLNNNFRRVILPNIHKFGLPQDIVLKFLILRQ